MEYLTQLLNWASLIPDWAVLGLAASGASTVITLSIPSRSDNAFWDFVLKVLNNLAGNVGHNKNADA